MSDQPTLPARREDALDCETSLSAAIDSSGLKLAGRSRALAAIDRLFGGLFGLAAAFPEGARAKIEAKNAADVRLIEADSKEAIDLLRASGHLGQAASQRFIREELHKQRNRQQVALQAIDALKALPAPGAQSDEDTANVELNPDWLNYLSDYAGKASTERMQQMWGAILAGEIRQPGAFSLSTMRVVSELDKSVAEAFQEIASTRLTGALFPADTLSGPKLTKWQLIQDAHLVHEVSSSGFEYTFSADADGFVSESTPNYFLLITFSGGTKSLALPMISLTRAGRELASIIPWDELASLRELANKLAPYGDHGAAMYRGYRGETATGTPNQADLVEIFRAAPGS